EPPVHGRFDLVTLVHALEHVPEPVATLARLAERLAPGGAGLHRGAQRRQRRHAPVLAPEGDPRSPRPPLPLRAADPGTSDREGRAEDARPAAIQSRRARVAARPSGASSAGVGRARSAGASRAARRPSSFGRARILAPAAALAQAAPAGKPDP